MSSTYVSSATGALANSNTVPSDGDTANAASVDVPLETIADDLWRLAQGARASTSIVKFLCTAYPDASSGATASRWGFAPGTGIVAPSWSCLTASTVNDSLHDHDLWFPIVLPHAASLTQVDFQVTAAGGHGALPTNMPAATIYQFDPVAYTMSSLVTKADPSASTGAYQTRHVFSILQANMPSGNPITISRSTPAWIRFVGEFGTNALGGLLLSYVAVTATIANAAAEAA